MNTLITKKHAPRGIKEKIKFINVEEDILYDEGRADEFYAMLQKKWHKTKLEVEDALRGREQALHF